mmetsp:Transcript_26116/g.85813  ORF Transcript_26116/g.85813 Transcript_26116/m.85813 type:complete len:80 (-) Transcript_26116:40-279(-)
MPRSTPISGCSSSTPIRIETSSPLCNEVALVDLCGRINVALTRAKHRLIMIGSRNTPRGHFLFAEMFKIITIVNTSFSL